MAIYNEILSGRFARSLQKIFSMKGANPSKQLSGEVMPVFPLFQGVENRYLESWDRFGFLVGIAGVNTQRAALQIRNPVGSKTMIVIEKLFLCNDQTATVADDATLTIAAQAADLTNVVAPTNNRLDRRGRASCTAIFSTTNNFGAIAGNTIWRGVLAINQFVDVILFEDQELTLLPGDAYILQANGTTGAGAGSANFIWRERPMEESELF